MNTFQNLKYYSVPILLLAAFISLIGYIAWTEYKIKDQIITEALQGNPHAINILANYEKPWTLEQRIVKEALSGNENALKVLKIDTLAIPSRAN